VRGNAIIIDHGVGVFSGYYHLSSLIVNTGDMVQKGQQIGKVGNTGRVDRADEYAGAGAHLHWEIWVNGIQVDPLEWINSDYP
jgi:murein DD-endopeptidase MepM/ murein hydrolase activator NlpD